MANYILIFDVDEVPPADPATGRSRTAVNAEVLALFTAELAAFKTACAELFGVGSFDDTPISIPGDELALAQTGMVIVECTPGDAKKITPLVEEIAPCSDDYRAY